MKFHSESSPYHLKRNDTRVNVENAYTKWVHDLRRGGELTAAYVKNGSNTNLLVSPQKVSIGIIEGRAYRQYSSDILPAESFTVTEDESRPIVNFTQRLANQEGKILQGLTVSHSVCYHEWGYSKHVVKFDLDSVIENVGQIQVGALALSSDFECCAIREGIANCGNLSGTCNVKKWQRLTAGSTRDDLPVHLSNRLALSVNIFKFGIEGIEFSLADDLAAWDNVISKKPGWQQTYLAYNKGFGGYELRFCPIDSFSLGQNLSSSCMLGFRLALPHVRKNIVPLRPSSGSLLYFGRSFENRWPKPEDIEEWKKTGVTLMRLHNDGNAHNNGIFWHGGSYPPYPADEMNKMDGCLNTLKKEGISVAPYFSVKEFHPESPGFKVNAGIWKRQVEKDGNMLHNYCNNGEFGVQMCLKSDWLERRKATIDQVLSKHLFNGVYYDWCAGMECVNTRHAAGSLRHWDQDGLQDLLEWSHNRVGDLGEIYLHMTGVPNLAAENLASLVLTEESGYGKISPMMLTPHVHFLNIVPRQICDMLGSNATKTERRKLALCALLHHATVSSVHQDYLEFYKTLPPIDFTRYTRHTAPGENITYVDNCMVGLSAYWKKDEALLLFANIADRELKIEWCLNTSKLGQAWQKRGTLKGKIVLKPLELRIRRIA